MHKRMNLTCQGLRPFQAGELFVTRAALATCIGLSAQFLPVKPEGVKVNRRRPNPAHAGPGAENLPLISTLYIIMDVFNEDISD